MRLIVVWLFCILPAAIFAKTGIGIDVDFTPRHLQQRLSPSESDASVVLIAQSWGGHSRDEFASSRLAGAGSAGMDVAVCDLDVIPNKARAAQVEYALSNSFA